MELQLSISSSNEYSGLTSFRIDWFYILAVQGTLSNFPQNHNLRTSILWLSAFFIVNIAHLYMTNQKNHRFDNNDSFMQRDSLLFNMLFRYVIDFLPRRKHLLI